MSIRVVLCDDHAVLRAGLKALLQSEPGLQVVGEASDGVETVERVLALRPDVAVIDITMPGQDGIAAARQVHRHAPEVKMLILTMHDDPEFLFRSLEAGASGYVQKRAAETELIEAIRQVDQGNAFVGDATIRSLAADYLARRDRGDVPVVVESLSGREETVLRLLARGFTNHEIADDLAISVKTVETHRAHILGKLGLRKRAELVRYAETHGLLAVGGMNTAVALGKRVDRLLSIGLTVKLLTANSVLVMLWAAATWLAVHLPDGAEGPTLGAVVLVGTSVSVALNALVLQSALGPLRELARVARAVESGDRAARARPGRVRDPETDRLMNLTNRMLDVLESQRGEIERGAAALSRLSKREMQAREEERRALAIELLDDVGQSCAAISLQIGTLARAIDSERVDPGVLRRDVADIQSQLRDVMSVVSRRAHGLHPSVLDHLGLAAALTSAAARWRNELAVEVILVADPIPPLGSTAEIALYRMAEEAVVSAVRGAGAHHVELVLGNGATGVELRVVDDGTRAASAEAIGDGLGLVRMRERLASAGGQLTILNEPGLRYALQATVPAMTTSLGALEEIRTSPDGNPIQRHEPSTVVRD